MLFRDDESTARILAIDGGGVKGLIPATFLSELERAVGRPVRDMFHMIAGTSTGAIIAMGMVKPEPYSARKSLDLYLDCAPHIFTRSRAHRLKTLGGLLASRYQSEAISMVLDQNLGDHWLSESAIDVLVTAYNIETRRPHIFRSWRAQGEQLTPGETPYKYDFPINMMVRGSTAAPTYFLPALVNGRDWRKHALVDGGVYANNPAMLAFTSAQKLYPKAKRFLVVSLGTGRTSRPIAYDTACSWGRASWAKPVIDILADAIDDTVDQQLTAQLPESDYHRYQIDLKRRRPNEPAPSDDIDDTRRENLARLIARSREMVQMSKNSFNSLVKELSVEKTARQNLV